MAKCTLYKHFFIKFVSDFRQVGGFHRGLRFPPPYDHDNDGPVNISLQELLYNIEPRTKGQLLCVMYLTEEIEVKEAKLKIYLFISGPLG